MNRSFPDNGSSGGGHCWARVGFGTTLNGHQEGILPTKSPEKLRGIRHIELHDHSWSLTRWTSVSLPRQRLPDSYLSSWAFSCYMKMPLLKHHMSFSAYGD